MTEDVAAEATVHVTENAANRVKKLIDLEGDPGLKLRIGVSGGGCSGFQYSFSLERETTDEDRLFPAHGITLVVDEISLGLLDGCAVDYVEDLIGASFRITNPNAASTCGCGHSFAV